jgi:N-acetylmuramoyl-L-alanine amidase
MNILHRPSPNFDNRPEGTDIDMLVLHYTGMKSAELALERLCDETAKVSAHYMIDEQGTVFQMVEEDKRAWHAGVSFWRGHTDINARSIGIEIVNQGHEFGYRPFPDIQIESVIELCQLILARHPIPKRNVVGHSDIAPTRKEDPGELFPWQYLASHGIGLWTSDVNACPVDSIQDQLNQFGYDTKDLGKSLIAFERHFHTEALTTPNPNKTQSRLMALLDLITE